VCKGLCITASTAAARCSVGCSSPPPVQLHLPAIATACRMISHCMHANTCSGPVSLHAHRASYRKAASTLLFKLLAGRPPTACYAVHALLFSAALAKDMPCCLNCLQHCCAGGHACARPRHSLTRKPRSLPSPAHQLRRRLCADSNALRRPVHCTTAAPGAAPAHAAGANRVASSRCCVPHHLWLLPHSSKE
jgi:hypothetical protein